MGIKGAGVGTGLSNALIFILMNLYALCQESVSEAITCPNAETFKDLRGYLEFGIPSTLMLWAEWWAFELIVLMGGWLGVEQQAALVILLTLADFFFQIPFGLQTAISAVVGQEIGRHNVKMAKKYNRVAIQISFTIVLITDLLFFLFRH